MSDGEYPTPSGITYISNADEQKMFRKSRENAAGLLKKVLRELDGWQYVTTKNDIKFFKKKSSDGKEYSINAITKISAGLDEVMDALYCKSTETYSALMSQLFDENLAKCVVMKDCPPRMDSSGSFRENCGIKYLAFKPFSTMGKARDYCFIDYSAVREAEQTDAKKKSADRIGIQLSYSVQRPECPDYAKSHKMERGTLRSSGYVVYPTSKEGVVEVIFCWSVRDTKTISRTYKKSILNIVQSICRLESALIALRRSRSGFLKPKTWIDDKDRHACFICEESFTTFRRRHHCRICGDITCSKCSTITDAKADNTDGEKSQVRACNQCMHAKVLAEEKKKDDQRKESDMAIQEHIQKFPTPDQSFSSSSKFSSKTSSLASSVAASSMTATSDRLHDEEAFSMSNSVPDSGRLGNMHASAASRIDNLHASANVRLNNMHPSAASRLGNVHPSAQNGARHIMPPPAAASIVKDQEPAKVQAPINASSTVHEKPVSSKLTSISSSKKAEATKVDEGETTISTETMIQSVEAQPFHYNLDFGWQNSWPKAPIPSDEEPRLHKLRSLNILDTPEEEEFDLMVECAIDSFQAEYAFVSFLDSNREWIKASHGLPFQEFQRDMSFCAHVVMSYEVTIVLDTALDIRFRDNPFVTGKPNLRFYVGFPLVTVEGFVIGTVAVADTAPRKAVTTGQLAVLQKLANHALSLLVDRTNSLVIASSSTSSTPYEPMQVQDTLMALLQKSYKTEMAMEETKNMMQGSNFTQLN